MGASAIQAQGLVVERGGNVVLPGLDLHVASGAVTGLLGPSGCGKTTLIRCIAGIQRIKAGTVTVLGESAGTPRNRTRIGYVTQNSSVYPDLTVAQNLHYFARLTGADHDAVNQALAQVDLADKKTALTRDLSGGQRTRVSLAAALVGNPDLYLLDEPTVGLDPILRRDLWALFAKLARNGRTLLVSSHVMDEAGRCHRVLLMREGRLIADQTPDELRTSAGTNDLEEAFLILAERSAQ